MHNSRCGRVSNIYLFGCGSHTHTGPINLIMISNTVNCFFVFFLRHVWFGVALQNGVKQDCLRRWFNLTVCKKVFDAGISVWRWLHAFDWLRVCLVCSIDQKGFDSPCTLKDKGPRTPSTRPLTTTTAYKRCRAQCKGIRALREWIKKTGGVLQTQNVKCKRLPNVGFLCLLLADMDRLLPIWECD